MLELISREPENSQHQTPILFVHGAWHGAWCWQEHFLPYFAGQGWSVHALSLRGHGNSPGREKMRRFTIQNYVDDVSEIARKLSAPPIVVGHSMGGFVIQKYLETYHAPAAILLASIPPAGILALTFRLLRQHPAAFLKSNLTLNLEPLVATPALAQELFFSEAMPVEQVTAYHGRLHNESIRMMFDTLFLNLPRPDRVKTPLQVLGATKDNIFTVKEVEKTAQTYGTEAAFFDMAHDMMLEPGWQAVADHMLRWLQTKGL